MRHPMGIRCIIVVPSTSDKLKMSLYNAASARRLAPVYNLEQLEVETALPIRKYHPICFNHKSGFFIKMPLIGTIHSICFSFCT